MKNEGLSPIVQTIAGLLFPLTLIFAFYIILHGHITPGGGFQGGAVGASAVVMLIVAFGAKKIYDKMGQEEMSIFESLGALIFVITGLLGLVVATSFLSNFLVGEALFGEIPAWGSNPGILNSGGFLPILNIAVGMKVIAGLSAVVLLMSLATEEEKK
jgi:multicomponent Na+:H+ antiporter subunit B